MTSCVDANMISSYNNFYALSKRTFIYLYMIATSSTPKRETDTPTNTGKLNSNKMDGRLYEAAMKGDTDMLSELLEKDANLLGQVMVGDVLKENVLHVAAQFGRLNFVMRILSLKPEFCRQLNSHGQSPLHVAADKGHNEIVKELLKIDTHACFVRDVHGMTPFHVAAMKGRLTVLEELIQVKSKAAWVLTDCGEPILHMCANNNQFGALNMLLEKTNDKEFFKLKDSEDNTIFHILAKKERPKEIKVLLEKMQNEVDFLVATNASNFTALDVARKIKGRCSRWKIKMALHVAGANKTGKGSQNKPKAGHVGFQKLGTLQSQPSSQTHETVLTSNSQEALMVVAILIATVTYTAVLNPPGGVWQEDGEHRSNDFIYKNVTDSKNETHFAGQAVISYKFPESYVGFTVFNTLGFLASIVLILVLVNGSSLQRKVYKRTMIATTWIAVISLLFTFGFSFYTLADKGCFFKIVLVSIPLIGLVVFGLLFIVFMVFLYRIIRWLLRKLSIKDLINRIRLLWTKLFTSKGHCANEGKSVIVV